jgi:hypothetical protein
MHNRRKNPASVSDEIDERAQTVNLRLEIEKEAASPIGNRHASLHDQTFWTPPPLSRGLKKEIDVNA